MIELDALRSSIADGVALANEHDSEALQVIEQAGIEPTGAMIVSKARSLRFLEEFEKAVDPLTMNWEDISYLILGVLSACWCDGAIVAARAARQEDEDA